MDRIAARAWSDASVSTVTGASRSQWARTGAVIKVLFSVLKAF